jgi:hypothetical protein
MGASGEGRPAIGSTASPRKMAAARNTACTGFK